MGVPVEQIERGMRRDEQQGLVLEGALGLHRDDLERVVPGVRDVFVELLVLLLRHLFFGPRPQRLHRVEGFGFDGDGILAAFPPFFLGGWGAALDVHPDGPGDEVGVFLDQVTDLPFRGVVVQVVLGVFRLEVQGDRRALGGILDGLDGVGALTAGLPSGGRALASLAGKQLDLVGHHERRVEADAELTDQFLGGGRVLGLTQLCAQLGGARLGQRANQIHHLLARHPDAVVTNGKSPCSFVCVDLDVQIGGVDLQVLVPQRLNPQLV